MSCFLLEPLLGSPVGLPNLTCPRESSVFSPALSPGCSSFLPTNLLQEPVFEQSFLIPSCPLSPYAFYSLSLCQLHLCVTYTHCDYLLQAMTFPAKMVSLYAPDVLAIPRMDHYFHCFKAFGFAILFVVNTFPLCPIHLLGLGLKAFLYLEPIRLNRL